MSAQKMNDTPENVPNRLSVEWVCASRLKCIIDENSGVCWTTPSNVSVMCVCVCAWVYKIELDECNLFSIPKLTLPSWTGISFELVSRKLQFAGCFLFIYLFSFISLYTTLTSLILNEIVLMLKEQNKAHTHTQRESACKKHLTYAAVAAAAITCDACVCPFRST